MELQDRLFSENTEDVLYSILMDEDEYNLYSIFKQKEFNSKAAKVRNAEFLKTIAETYSPNLYKDWHETVAKQEAREILKDIMVHGEWKKKKGDTGFNINTLINGKPWNEEASYRRSVSPDRHYGFAENWRNKLKPTNKEQQEIYDHGRKDLDKNRLLNGNAVGYGSTSSFSPEDLKWRLNEIRRKRLEKKEKINNSYMVITEKLVIIN